MHIKSTLGREEAEERGALHGESTDMPSCSSSLSFPLPPPPSMFVRFFAFFFLSNILCVCSVKIISINCDCSRNRQGFSLWSERKKGLGAEVVCDIWAIGPCLGLSWDLHVLGPQLYAMVWLLMCWKVKKNAIQDSNAHKC